MNHNLFLLFYNLLQPIKRTLPGCRASLLSPGRSLDKERRFLLGGSEGHRSLYWRRGGRGGEEERRREEGKGERKKRESPYM